MIFILVIYLILDERSWLIKLSIQEVGFKLNSFLKILFIEVSVVHLQILQNKSSRKPEVRKKRLELTLTLETNALKLNTDSELSEHSLFDMETPKKLHRFILISSGSPTE